MNRAVFACTLVLLPFAIASVDADEDNTAAGRATIGDTDAGDTETGDIDADLRELDAMRKGLDTDFSAVNARGKELLKQYAQPVDQAQIHYQLAHVHAQSGMKHPDAIIEHARAALKSQTLSPEQRGTLYSYVSSAHEVDKSVKDFAERRRRAVAPLLAGLAELKKFDLPAVAPELPLIGKGGIEIGGDPSEEALRRKRQEDQINARREAERVRDLVARRDTLKMQAKWLYARSPTDDQELRTLAAKALDDKQADELVGSAKQERERVANERRERDAKSAALAIKVSVLDDGRTIVAKDASGKALWQADVIKAAGPPGVGESKVRQVSVKNDRVSVVYGKHSFAEFDLATGKFLGGGSD